MSAGEKIVSFPRQLPIFVLELHSERMIDCLHSLIAAGFKVTYIKDSMNRYSITDEETVDVE